MNANTRLRTNIRGVVVPTIGRVMPELDCIFLNIAHVYRNPSIANPSESPGGSEDAYKSVACFPNQVDIQEFDSYP